MSVDDHGRCSTYTRHGCRCDECREAMSIYMREYRRAKPAYDRAYHRAINRAVSWVRSEHPDVWRRFLEQAMTEQDS